MLYPEKKRKDVTTRKKVSHLIVKDLLSFKKTFFTLSKTFLLYPFREISLFLLKRLFYSLFLLERLFYSLFLLEISREISRERYGYCIPKRNGKSAGKDTDIVSRKETRLFYSLLKSFFL